MTDTDPSTGAEYFSVAKYDQSIWRNHTDLEWDGEPYTEERVLELVLAHMAQQTKASKRDGLCTYATAEGENCNIGALVPSEFTLFWNRAHSLGSILGLWDYGTDKWSLGLESLFKSLDPYFLRGIQRLHDYRRFRDFDSPDTLSDAGRIEILCLRLRD